MFLYLAFLFYTHTYPWVHLSLGLLALFQFSLWLSIDFRYHLFGSLVLLFSTVSSLISFCSFLLVLPPGSNRRRLLVLLREWAVPIAVPALLLPERIAVNGPGRQDADLACQQQGAGVAAQYRLHGSDTVYTIVALRFSNTLITPGRERRKRMVEALLAHCLTETLAGRECAAAGRYG